LIGIHVPYSGPTLTATVRFGHSVSGPDERALAVARYQGKRLARYAQVIGAARRDGAFDVARPLRTIYPAVTPDPT
jgi:hypothetical protein